jgi:hypothetical protein
MAGRLGSETAEAVRRVHAAIQRARDARERAWAACELAEALIERTRSARGSTPTPRGPPGGHTTSLQLPSGWGIQRLP